MNKKWKKLWVAALRGGKFKQGAGGLRLKDNRCCCLGVLCDLMDSHRWERSDGVYYWVYGNSFSFPSEEINVAAGLNPSTLLILANMNDSGKSFKQIADWIEKHL